MARPEVVKIRLFGTDYAVESSADIAYTKKLGRFVDEKMHEVAQTLSLRSVSPIAGLAAGNLADEVRQLREGSDRIDRAAAQSADRLSALIDRTSVSGS